jgi:hypothetical protein
MDLVATIRNEVEKLEGVPESLQNALDDVFSRAEAEVRSRAESSMTDELNDSAATLPLPGYGGNGSGVRAAKRASRSAARATRGRQPPPREPPNAATMDRAYLEGRYGIPKPKPVPKQRSMGRVQAGKIASAMTTGPNALLPKMNRQDPAAPPPAVYPSDLEHGVANLQNRGFIPPSADVTPAFTHDPAPVTAGNAPLYPHDEQHAKGEIYSSPFGFNAVNLKLDLVTSTHPAPSGVGGDSQQYGWEQMAQIEAEDSAMERSQALDDGQAEVEAARAAVEEARAVLEAAQESGDQTAVEAAAERLRQMEDALAAANANADSSAEGAAQPQSTHEPARIGINMSEDDSNTAMLAPGGSSLDMGEDTTGGVRLSGNVPAHHLIIRDGELVQTNELTAFLRKYRSRAGILKDLLAILQTTLSRYGVPLGVVDGLLLVKLGDKGDGDMMEPTEHEAIATLVNRDQVYTQIGMPGAAFRGVDGPDAAATTVQAAWRGTQARRDHALHVAVEKAAASIAARWRLHWQMRETQARVAEIQAQREVAWEATQQDFRDRWKTIRAKTRVEIHIPSLSRPRHQRISLSNMAARQNSQMARLCRLSDPLVDVVYVCPFPLSEDVAQYYHKLLGVGGVADASSRYRLVYPENYDRLPFGMSLASMLLYSPRCLKRIRNFCRGKEAYLVPSVVGPEDKLLSQILGMPLMGPEPTICRTLGSKLGAKQIFEEAQVNMPTGTTAGRSEGEFFERFAGMIVSNPSIPRWIMKVDDEFNGRGHAHFDVTYLRTHRKLVRDVPETLEEDELARVQVDMCAELQAIISKRVQITTKGLFRNWREFLGALIGRGGVIEACPARVSGSPSANLWVQPSGEVSLLCTHDQMFSPPYCFVGASFPQSSVPFGALRAAAMGIGRVCAARGIHGYIGVDFVAYQHPEGLRLLAVDLNLRYTDTLAAFHMFDFLMGGRYESANTGRYFVDKRPGVVLAPLTAAQVASPQQHGLATRHYVVSQYVRHPNLSSIQYSNFFNLCRMKGISFDLQEKKGTAFNLVDSFATGVLGIMGVGSSLLDCFSTVERGLLFIQKQVGVHKAPFADSEEDDANFKDILAAVKFVVQILSTAAAKAQK